MSIEQSDVPMPAGTRVPETLIGRIMKTYELLAVRPYTAAELARELDINRSTSLRLLSEMITTGYVARDPDTKRYATVPSRFLNLVAQQDPGSDWSQMIDPILAQIRDETGDSTMLGVPAGTMMIYLAYFPTFHVLGVSERLGATRPMHCSGLGKAYLSALPADAFEELLGRLTFEGGSAHALKDATALRADVEAARANGYAFDLEETYEGVHCVAVPLRLGGNLMGAVGISSPATRLAIPRMRELGGFLSHRLGRL
ncbi:IclR family transcriptional regulator [Microbacterium sp. ASV49]|uniref:IclR family transcriptional regulator n=1 Tax=Microbacterium candidum TaxID=3041922 RepID=A0ABT7N224_9MICO|nr:IclR family transcriptional regulator [Microbacterium sp. ASV49]MDL9980753.1 IclR family transcriptional regulator [Microbacterium sp. ASV49]